MKYTLAALALIYGAEAIQIEKQFRPYTDGRTPWYVDETENRHNPYPWPHDYKVPDFGPDPDIHATHQNIKTAEKKLEHTWNLPSLAQASSDPVCSSAGCTQYAHKATPLGYAIDYPVPNHGPDPDMVGTQRSIEIGEAAHAHKLIMGTAESAAKWHNVAKDTPYNFAPDLDEDMTHTAKHLTDSQTRLGHSWVIESDPAYTAPAFAQVKSDPICSSAGCTQFAHKKTPLGYDINYPVPSFGADPEMTATARSIEIGEAAHSHKLIMGTAESQAKWHNVAKDTQYNFAPDLDEDMLHTSKHLTDSQSRLGHTLVIEDDPAWKPNY